ncbi:MAG: DUF5121 domain-containing protein [Candidatus Cryptobacteroides sp.]
MKLKNIAYLCAAIAIASACKDDPTFVRAGKGPEMAILSQTESTYMGAGVNVSVNLSDKDFALSTIKAYLYYGETEVASTTVRTKTEGQYDITLKAPLLKDVPDGTASLVLKAQNVGLGITETTLDVALRRPDFETINIVDENGKTYVMTRTGDYIYECTENFPAYVNANIVSPEFNEGETIVLGWDGSGLTSSSEELIPFGASIPGYYTIKIDLMKLTVSPTGNADVVSVAHYTQGQTMEFGNVVSIENWNLDPDFFSISEDKKSVTFRAVDGLYKMAYDTKEMFIKVEPVDEGGNPLSLSSDGTGAVWVIGSGVGKPAIGPSWNTDDGAYPFARVQDKVYELTLATPGQLAISGSDFKFFHQKGWGGEFATSNYKSVNIGPAFTMDASSGNIKPAEIEAGKGYKFILDLTEGVNAAKLSYEEVEVASGGLEITVNGEKALKMSSSVYKVPAVKVEKNSIITFSGIDNPLEWIIDNDHFELTSEGLKFKAITGFYSFELNIENKYVIVRHVKEDGKAATYANEKAITFMGWGVGYPAMAQQLAWESGLLITLAQIEDGVYQFTGIACEDGDETPVGNCWRATDISFKFFGQAGWGDEWGTVTLTDEAKKYLEVSGNVELILDHKDGDTKVFKPLEVGAKYRMTVTDCSALNGNKFDVTIDFRKID